MKQKKMKKTITSLFFTPTNHNVAASKINVKKINRFEEENMSN